MQGCPAVLFRPWSDPESQPDAPRVYPRPDEVRITRLLAQRQFNTGTIGFAAPEQYSGLHSSGHRACVCQTRKPSAARRLARLEIAYPQSHNSHLSASQQTHHDALEFPEGQMVLLTNLFEGQEATVLQLPAQPVTAAEIKAQERVASVGWRHGPSLRRPLLPTHCCASRVRSD
jgi:hypothetical protein